VGKAGHGLRVLVHRSSIRILFESGQPAEWQLNGSLEVFEGYVEELPSLCTINPSSIQEMPAVAASFPGDDNAGCAGPAAFPAAACRHTLVTRLARLAEDSLRAERPAVLVFGKVVNLHHVLPQSHR